MKALPDYPPRKIVDELIEVLNELCWTCQGLGNCLRCQCCILPSEEKCKEHRSLFENKKETTRQ